MKSTLRQECERAVSRSSPLDEPCRTPRKLCHVTTAPDYLRLALDRIRLAVLGAAAVGPVSSAELAGALGVAERRVLRAIGRLREAGLLTDDLRLDLAALRRIGQTMPAVADASQEVIAGPWTADERIVLERFFEGSRLREIPMNRAKRHIVLERLAQEFEPGLRYPEQEVNRRLQVFHEDYAALRRYMVDDGLLTRAEGVYWRSGGRYEPIGS